MSMMVLGVWYLAIKGL